MLLAIQQACVKAIHFVTGSCKCSSATSLISYLIHMIVLQNLVRGFPGGAVVENLPANAGDTGLSPALGRSHMPRSN